MVEVTCDYPPCGKRFKKERSKALHDKHSFHSTECRIAYDREYGIERKGIDLRHQKNLQRLAELYRKKHGSPESDPGKRQLMREWEQKRIAAGMKHRIVERRFH